MRRRWAASLIAGLCMVAGNAWAETYTVTVTPSAVLDKFARGTTNTVFRIPTGGGGSVISGNGARISTGGVNAATATVNCVNGGGSGNCNHDTIVTIARVGALGANADFTGFTVGGFSCAPGCTMTVPTGTSPLTFTIVGLSNGRTATFNIGSDVTVFSSAASGNHTFDMSVTALEP